MKQAFRGPILHFLDDPSGPGGAGALEYREDGLLIVEDGHVLVLGDARDLLPTLTAGTVVTDCAGRLIVPGFIDAHTHFVQTDVIGSYGRRLLDWLEEYTFPAERAFADEAHARSVAALSIRCTMSATAEMSTDVDGTCVSVLVGIETSRRAASRPNSP